MMGKLIGRSRAIPSRCEAKGEPDELDLRFWLSKVMTEKVVEVRTELTLWKAR